jgi:hypothetical protein
VATFALEPPLALERRTGLSPGEAWARARALLAGYEALGYVVRPGPDAAPRATADVEDTLGTRLRASVEVAADGAGALVTVRLGGVVAVPGPAGALATAGQVRAVALARLRELVDGALPAASPPLDPLEARLRVVAALLERGLIDAAEARAKRAELLDEL